MDLSLESYREWLESRDPDSVAGIRGDSTSCVIANWKSGHAGYVGRFVLAIPSSDSAASYITVDDETVQMPEWMNDHAIRFDRLPRIAPTVREVLELLPAPA